MLIFIYGDDGFRASEKVHLMIKTFRQKFDSTGLNIAEFSTIGRKGADVGDILGAVHALPFLGTKRMVVLKDLIGQVKKPEMQIWIDGFTKTPDSTIVIFWESTEPKALEKKPLFKALVDVAEVHHYPFPQLQGSELTSWVKDRVKEHRGTIDVSALRVLVERVGADLWQMDNEIGKLVAYANTETISIAMVEELVRASFEGKIFQLIDAVSQRRPTEAIRLLQEERWSGANDHYLLTMLGRQVRILLGAKGLLEEHPQATKQELADTLNIHPFVAQKALAQSRAFSLAQLKSVHDFLFESDYQLKTGQINADMAVDLATIKLTQ
ncbi:DNA polymerase III subunit delta [Candidatus Uhrbacteria bacterium]|nr:DNA polymerase III subunit delta [Candidatus Uhrbacteria bacterium]